MLCKVLVAVAMMAQPVAAECFAGQPRQVTYSNGQVMSVLDRDGDVVTHQWRTGGSEGDVRTSHLMVFDLERTHEGKTLRDKWKGRLPASADLVPGYRFDIEGKTTFASGGSSPVRMQGEVMPPATVTLGNCVYETTVIYTSYFVGETWMMSTTTYLRMDMMVALQSENFSLGAEPLERVATGLE